MKIIFSFLLSSLTVTASIFAQNQAPQIPNDNNTGTPVVVNSSYYDRYNDGTKILSFNSAAYLPFTVKASNLGGTQNFRTLMPPAYNQNDTKKYPLVINLHGLGESGDSNGNCGGSPCNANNEKQLTFWANQHIQANNNGYPAFYIFPQCVTTYWNNNQTENGYMQFRNPGNGQPYNPSDAIRRVLQLIDFIVNEGITTNGVKFNIDPNRVYVMGYSLGGNGAFDMLIRRQDLVAGGIPVSVTGDRYEGKNLAHIPIWYWQGTNDGLFSASQARVVKDSLFKYAGFRRDNQFTDFQWNANDINQYAGNKRYTEVTSSGHNTWTFAIQHPDLYRWLFSQSKLKINTFGDTTISAGSNIRIGVAPGFAEYQWKKDANLLSYTTNEITVNASGKYYVRVRRSVLGWSEWSQPIDIRNSNPDSENPSNPTNLSASEVTNSSFKLSWTSSTDNIGVAGYDVFRNGVKINTVNVSTSFYTISGLTQNTDYTMTVKARDAYGNTSASSVPLVITTTNSAAPTLDATWILDFGWQYSASVINYNNLFPGSFPVTSGTAYNNLKKTDGGSSNTNFVLTSSVSGGGNATGCTGGVFAEAATKSWWRVENNEVFTAKFTGLNVGKSYTLTFFHNSGNDNAVADYTVNGIVKTLNGKNNCSNTVVFSNLQPNSSGEITFSLSRNTGYYEAGLNVLKIEQFSTSGSPTPPDTQSPGVVSNLASSAITATSFTLNWSASGDNVGVTGYEVYKNGTKIGETASLNYPVTALSSNSTYAMTVKAKDAAGNISAASTALSVTTNSGGATPVLESTWLVNFGGQYSTQVANYNNLFPNSFPVASGTVFNALKKNDGSTSSTGFTITQAVPGGGNIAGCTSGIYGAGGGSWWRIQNGQTMAFKFTGLLTNKFYSVILLQSTGDNNSVSNFTVQGTTKILSGQNNCSNTISFDNIQPNAAGEIEIVVSQSTGYFEAGVNVIELRQFPTITPARLSAKSVNSENKSTDNTLQFYPNPTQGLLSVIYNSDNEQVININVTDAWGRSVKEISQQLFTGTNEVKIDLTGNQAGVYFIRLDTGKIHRVVVSK